MPKLSLAKLERHLYATADILRSEGMDAAMYKDYIFGLLFLKRCSDVFDAERERLIDRRVAQGMAREMAELRYGEEPDHYDTFFVPERARWGYLQKSLEDASEPYGRVLDKALGALTEANDTLEHVLDHISFMRVQGTKRIVSDDACKRLVQHFSRHRLRNEEFQFSDLLGSAYEFLINMFAESAEGRRLLHASRRDPPDGPHPQAHAGHEHLRPDLRVRRHADHQPRVRRAVRRRPDRPSPTWPGKRSQTPSSMPAARRTTCARSTSKKSSPPSSASPTCPATRGASRWRRSPIPPTTGISIFVAT
jgi:hypothetical protein